MLHACNPGKKSQRTEGSSEGVHETLTCSPEIYFEGTPEMAEMYVLT